MRIGELSISDVERRLAGPGLGVRLGPFDVRIVARVADLAPALQGLYADFPLLDDGGLFSFHVQLLERRRWLARPRRIVRFLVDGRAPHQDMPAEHALAVLEWGINLVISFRYHRYLMLHAGVVERHGNAIVLPAEPGSGKTTLCAAMMLRGWRLLSDEFGLVLPEACSLVPLPRPMPLKNDSIEIIHSFASDAVLGPRIEGTRKGTIAHLKPSTDSVARADDPAMPGFVVFPKWSADATLSLRAVPPAESFARLAVNSFNFELLGATGFRAVSEIISRASCHELEYSTLDEAIETLSDLAAPRDDRT